MSDVLRELQSRGWRLFNELVYAGYGPVFWLAEKGGIDLQVNFGDGLATFHGDDIISAMTAALSEAHRRPAPPEATDAK